MIEGGFSEWSSIRKKGAVGLEEAEMGLLSASSQILAAYNALVSSGYCQTEAGIRDNATPQCNTTQHNNHKGIQGNSTP